MIDIKLIIENPKKVQELLAKKGFDTSFSSLLKLNEERKTILMKVESSKAEQNKLSASVPLLKKEGKDVSEIFKKVKQLSDDNKNDVLKLEKIEKEIYDFLVVLPNLPDEDLLPGGKENNKVIHTYGKKPVFAFKAKDHVELCESLGLVDYQRAAKISGSGTWIYTNLGARLEWAILNYFISEHLKDGYEFILPPHILNYESGLVAGQFPKFEEDVFWLEGVSPRKFI